MSLIKLDNVSKYYNSENTVSVGIKKVNLEFDLGEFVVVTGESGSGKTTLLNVLSGLDGYESGEMYLFGEETNHYIISDWERYRSAYVGFVFQNYNIIDSYTVLQNVLLALEIQEYDPKKRKERALQLIEQVGLTKRKHHKAAKLSGGEKQRVVIARALAKNCPIIAADEPTGNLDSESSKQIMKLLHDVSKDKLVILVTHDYEQVEMYATRKIKMLDGKVVEDKRLTTHQEIILDEKIEPKQMKFLTLLQLTFRNFFATPKRLIFMLLLQIILATAFIIVYANLIEAINKAGLMQAENFPVVPETRLLVEKRDGSEFTDSDIKSLEKIKGIKKVHKYANNFYNIYQLRINNVFLGNVKATDTAMFLNPNEIKGRLPVAKDEIVVSSYRNQIEIGMEITLFIDCDFECYDSIVTDFGLNEPPTIGPFKVVGIDKLNRKTIYFSEEYLNSPTSDILIDYELFALNHENILSTMWIVDDYDNYYHLLEGTNDPQYNLYSYDNNYEVLSTINLTVHSTDLNNKKLKLELKDVSLIGPDLETLSSPTDVLVKINRSFYLQIRDELYNQSKDVYEVRKKLVSISVNGYPNGRKVMERIDSEYYKVYYPIHNYSVEREQLIVQALLLAILLLLLIGILIIISTIIVTKKIMKSRIKDFAIYRSIGANKYMLARLVILEQIILSIFAFFITIIVMLILKDNIYQISKTILYLQYYDFIILLLIFIILGTILGFKYNNKLFNQSVIETINENKDDY